MRRTTVLLAAWIGAGCGADDPPPDADAGPDAGASDPTADTDAPQTSGLTTDTADESGVDPSDPSSATTDPDATSSTSGSTTADPDEDCPPGDGTFAVVSVAGEIADGAQVVVCGNAFGDLGPTIVLFDDMEEGEPGASVADATPTIGAWLEGRGVYADDASRSGALSMVAADADIDGGTGRSTVFGIPDASGNLGLREFDEFFVSLAIRDLGDFPGNNSSPTSFSSDSSAKDVWVMFGNRGDNYDYSCSQGECNGNDVVLATHAGGGSFAIGGNTTLTGWWLPTFWQFQTWNVTSTWVRLDPDDPYGPVTGTFEHVASTSGYVRNDYDEGLLRDLDGIPPTWDRIKFAAWYRGAGDVRRVFDDLYVAIGPGSAARIEIADAPVIENATKRAISTVDAWSDGRIEVTLRLGDLDPAVDPLYLYVIDANHVRSPGFALAP